MNKYFQVSFFLMLVSGLMILYGRLGMHHESWFVDNSHFLKIGMLGVCTFMIAIGFLLAGLLFGREE